MIAAFHLLFGLIAGVLQAHLLRGRSTPTNPLGLLLRLGVVTLALLVAALGGHLLAAVAGWAIGFSVAVVVHVWRWT